MKKRFQCAAAGLVLLTAASTKKENRIPEDLRQMIGFKDAHRIVDSIR